MKIHLNLDLLSEQDLSGFTEVMFLIPYLSDDLYSAMVKCANPWNEGLFTKLFFNGNALFENGNLENCDYSIIPYKYNYNDSRTAIICDRARLHGKVVLAFYNDDYAGKLDLFDNLILFRTSVGRSQIEKSERVLPVLIADHFTGSYEANNSIGFCGYVHDCRKNALEMISDLYEVDIVQRNGFFAEDIPKTQARREYYANLVNNKFTFCMRGQGNFSYRFYESLSFGRIPILISTDTILPLENIIDWDKHIIFIENYEYGKLTKAIEQNFDMHANRKLWEEFFSPHGFIKNITKFIA